MTAESGAHTTLRVEEVSSYEELEKYSRQLDELANEASEPNPFYEAWMLIPALKHYADKETTVALVRDAGQGDQILGVFPLGFKRGYRHMPVSFPALWTYPHCFLRTPIVKSGREEDVLRTFIVWLDNKAEAVPLFEFGEFAASGPFHKALSQLLAKDNRIVDEVNQYERAFFTPGASYETYIEGALRRKRLKDFRKKGDNLARLGAIAVSRLDHEDNVDKWVDDFMRLEASGWKGRSGSAMKCDLRDRAFFVDIARRGLALGRLSFNALTLNGSPVSMSVILKSGPGRFAFKVAYDEEYAVYSPGALLDFEVLKEAHKDTELAYIDSCTAPDNHHLNRLMTGRRVMKSLAISRRTTLSRAFVSAMSTLHSFIAPVVRPAVAPESEPA